MAQELKVCEAYICHNEFSQNELPQKKDAIVKSASHKEEDDWWDYAAKIECYRKEDADKVIAHHKYKRCLDKAKQCTSMMIFNSKYGTDKKWHLFKKWRDRWLALAEKFKEAKL